MDGLSVVAFASVDDATRRLIGGSARPTPGVGIAVNPEKIMAARRNVALREALEQATVLFPDGGGVAFVMRRGGTPTARIPGCELWEGLLTKATAARVFLVGGKPGVVERVRERLASAYPAVNVVGLRDGYFSREEEGPLFDAINDARADLVSVGLGSPKQELFMMRAAAACPNSFFLGVGGTYDVFLGDVRRAPRAFRAMGFEWAYRLLTDPLRWRRQTALLEFLGLFLTRRLNGRRPNGSGAC